ncbi:MAG TPA: hypothetical protein DDX39_00140 [Bacteroidales bacterium]|nr:MAG: hypothetical protein A2W98_03415 [Bacteroidetes bacterium GWF2_33_38]OFY72174.1 MAG: hypothetical protein A2265_08690 [Bacteroidetes bacterium RIFOXYA12_FULL_33_9]OFY85791.1 MAG: hypothetical protein A2236_05980 [Bacteroidetes bacterium RIFOXYA2_FULL_33_7]HBF87018.1 hypothetical protein [Bacteroidales bacterium]
MRKSYKKYIKEVLSDNPKGLHIDEITKKIKPFFPDLSSEKLKTSINATLSNDINNNGSKSEFKKMKGEKGRNKKGYYQLKRKKQSITEKIGTKIEKSETIESLTDKISDNYKGKAGEYAVISELLFRGYNTGMMALDEGIDITAIKDNKKFNIQVKTRTIKNNTISVVLNYDYYLKNEKFETYYIIIIRYKPKNERIRNEYLIFHPRDLKIYFNDEIKNKKNLKFTIKIDNARFKLDNYDLNKHLNDFESII